MRDANSKRTVEEECRALVEKLGGRWTSSGGMCRCPAHKDRTPSLSIRPGRSRVLLHCFAGCDSSDILRALASARLIEPQSRQARYDLGNTGADDRRRAAAIRLWEQARPIGGTPAAAYLAGRGLHANPPELRFHPRTPCGPEPFTCDRPALVAAVCDETGLVAVHRTFLDCGSACASGFPIERRGLGRFGRGAVRLGGSAPSLGLAEGIETAMSATAIFGISCWASLGAERFGSIALPCEVRRLLLFLDNDAGGRRAEALARQKHEGVLSIEAHYPGRRGADWNDILMAAQGSLSGG